MLPWQRHVADVALEVNPDTGGLVYDEVRLTVPRQSGKTTLLLAVLVHRALAAKAFGGRQRLIYTAQSRNDAREKLLEDFVPVLDESRYMRGRYRVRRANGSEGIKFAGGSRLGLIASKKESGHGPTCDVGCIDEAFAQRDDRLEQSLGPTMITRPAPQLWIVSTQGDDDSTYLNTKVETGRQLIRDGVTQTSIAYFEWSAADSFDDLGELDPADPAVWRSCMPALGLTVTEDRIRARYESMSQDPKEGVGGFCRAFLNIRRAGTVLSVIPLGWWRACADPGGQVAGRIVLAVDVDNERAWGAIALAGRRADGLPQLEILRREPGTDWIVEAAAGYSQRNNRAPVVVDAAGPAASLVSDLRARKVDVVITNAGDMAQACGRTYDAVRDGAVRHLGDPVLEAALKGADKRVLGDAWAWRRRTSSADICPLVAATLALWGLATIPEAVDPLSQIW